MAQYWQKTGHVSGTDGVCERETGTERLGGRDMERETQRDGDRERQRQRQRD